MIDKMKKFQTGGGVEKIFKCYEERMKLLEQYVSDCAAESDQETTPNNVWDVLYKYLDFIKQTTADIFPYNKKWTKYHHFCGWRRNISARDVFINSPWYDEGAALAILKALKLFFEGANVGLLIEWRSYYFS